MKRLISPSFLLALALLIAVEIALRWLLPPSFTVAFDYGFNPAAGFEESGDGMVRLAAGGGRDFHPQAFLRHRPDGVDRIFVFGDSVEYGHVPPCLSNTYPARLAAELQQRGIKAESFNLGVVGVGTLREQVMLRQVLAYQPTLLVFKLNDSNDLLEEAAFRRAREFRSWHPKDWLRKTFVVQSLLVLKEDHLMRHWLAPKIFAMNLKPDAKPPSTTAQSSSSPQLSERFCRTVRENVALARARNIPVLLITQAYVTHDAKGQIEVSDHGLNAFAEELSGPGVSCLSMVQLFTPLTPGLVFVDHMHLNETGHRMVAHALAERIFP
ncbi:MAG: lipolytic protein family [Pedosphaera sp.]|nr:lipolytic protein family [Pedosphaera sp.]